MAQLHAPQRRSPLSSAPCLLHLAIRAESLVALQGGLDFEKEVLGDDRLMLARMDLVAVADLADVGDVLQELMDAGLAKGDASLRDSFLVVHCLVVHPRRLSSRAVSESDWVFRYSSKISRTRWASSSFTTSLPLTTS